MRGSARRLHVFPIARVAPRLPRWRTAWRLGELLVGEGSTRPRLRCTWCRARALVAVGAEHPAVGFGDHVAVLVEEVDVVDLLERAAGELGLVLDQSP
jgi:hypothetical protein